uniref:Uncharacterized protein n=1 Tax=Callorhinchus milii TaxID=7868 RepID=A0A4W3HFM4_CALMI
LHSQVQDGRHRDHNDLKDPEPDVGERSEGIIAHVLAARLLRVAHELALLVVVDGLTAHRRQHDPEHDQHRQPDLPHEGRVVVDLLQQPGQEAPAHGAHWVGG